jgi:hypothetical protein
VNTNAIKYIPLCVIYIPSRRLISVIFSPLQIIAKKHLLARLKRFF